MKNIVKILLLSVVVLVLSCAKDPDLTRSKVALTTVFNRGDVVDLGVTDTMICFLNSKDELVVINRNTEDYRFYHDINSTIESVSEVEAIGDSLILIGDRNNGIFYFSDFEMVVLDSLKPIAGFDHAIDKCVATATLSISGLTFDTHGGSVSHASSGFVGVNKLTSMVAYQDTCWLGTLAYGLYYVEGSNPNKRRQLPPEFIGNHKVKQVKFDENKDLWVVTEGGISYRKNGAWKVYRSPVWLKLNYSAQIGANVYVATNLGLYILDLQTGEYLEAEHINSLLPYPVVNVLEVDRENNLWLGTGNGLFRFKP